MSDRAKGAVHAFRSDEQAIVREMHGQGFSLNDIARRLGRSHQSVRDHCVKMGLDTGHARGVLFRQYKLLGLGVPPAGEIARAVAQDAARAAGKTVPGHKMRTCLTCRRAFQSSGPGHRWCGCERPGWSAEPYRVAM